MSLHVPEDGGTRVLRNLCRCSATNALPHCTQHSLSTPQLTPHSQILMHTSPYIIPHDTSLLIKVSPSPSLHPPITHFPFIPSLFRQKNKIDVSGQYCAGPYVYPRLLPCDVSACGWKNRVDANSCSCIDGAGLPLNYRRVDCRVPAYRRVKPRLDVTVV